MQGNLLMNKRQETDAVRRAISGDPGAWEQLYHHHKPTVHAWCWQMTRNPADADELTQEIFMRAFLGLSRFRKQAKLKTWLYRVTVNCVLMHRRKPHHRELSHDVASMNKDDFGTTADVCDSISGPTIERLILQQAMDGLPIEKRAVFVLHEFFGMTHREIGRRLSLSVANSKCRLRRARLNLRQALAS